MPWRAVPGEFSTLGYLIADWIEANCVIPDGERMGEPFLLTKEQERFIQRHYQLRPDAKADREKPSAAFVHRRSQLVRPQKWGKGPLSAAIVCAEAGGPVLFAGWDANGEPVGRPWATPWVQITAVSEDQTENVWRALLPMIELGALKDAIPDTGLTRINLPGGGYIEPVTASARSRLGQRITFAVQDETHSWLRANGGHALADNQRRNLAGMGGRSIETTNAWNPAERSVAQLTYKAAESSPDIWADYPRPAPGSFKNKRERRHVLRHAYQGAPWVDLDRIDAECEELLGRDEEAQAERFYGNREVAAGDQAFNPQRWATLTTDTKPEPGTVVVVGVDGARYDDALAIIATAVDSGHQWPVTILERPENAGDDYEHPFDEADAALEGLFNQYRVWRVYVDPQEIDSLCDLWIGRWGKETVLHWRTDRARPMAFACRSYNAAQVSGDLTHDGDPAFARHVANAVRRPANVQDDDGRPLWTVRKEYRGSPRKIDAAVAGIISWEARGDAIAAGALRKARRGGGSI